MKMSRSIKIHGKEYMPVAARVNDFRQNYSIKEGYGISTEIVSLTDDVVVVKASVTNPDGFVLGTGHAEEKRAASQINKTSALENAETSAIGRALAACGFGGSEYASANEVENAIHQQEERKPANKSNITSKLSAERVEGMAVELEKLGFGRQVFPDLVRHAIGVSKNLNELTESEALEVWTWAKKDQKAA